MTATWVQTSRRLLPRLAKLSREIRPTFHLDSVMGLDAETLRGLGVEAVLWDVDGTLMAHHAGRVDPSVAAAFGELLAAPGLRHAIVSNCQEDRFAELGRIFPGLPVLSGHETENGVAFRVRRGDTEGWWGPGGGGAMLDAVRAATPGPGAVAAAAAGNGAASIKAPLIEGGEIGLGPIRKPSRRLVRAALEWLKVEDRPEAALMVGDQYFTDIASANLAGIRSLKVATLHRASFPRPVRVSQRLEGLLYRLRYGRPRRGLG